MPARLHAEIVLSKVNLYTYVGFDVDDLDFEDSSILPDTTDTTDPDSTEDQATYSSSHDNDIKELQNGMVHLSLFFSCFVAKLSTYCVIYV